MLRIKIIKAKFAGDDEKKMIHTIRQVQQAVYSTAQFWEGLPYVSIMAGIFTGGIVVWYLLYWGAEYVLLTEQRGTRYVACGRNADGSTRWINPDTESLIDFIQHHLQVALVTLFFAGMVFIVWIAASIAGFDPWASSLTAIGISAIATYVFSDPLRLAGCGYWILLMRRIRIGQYREVHGMGPQWGGFVRRIYLSHVEMETFDEETHSTVTVEVPTTTILNSALRVNHRVAADLLEQRPSITPDQLIVRTAPAHNGMRRRAARVPVINDV